MVVFDEIKYQLETVGYAIYPKLLTEEKCEKLKDLLKQAIESYESNHTERSKQDRYHIHDLLVRNIEFAKLLEDEKLNKLVSLLLGDYWIMYAFTSSSLPPHESNFGGRLHVDSPRLIDKYPTNVGVIWALDEFTIENGCTKVLPASQHSHIVPTEELFEKNAVPVLCNKGDLVIFNARVWHRAGFNTTENWRHSLTMNCCRPFMKQRMDWVRFIPKNIADNVNEQARRIIGYDTRLPKNLEELFVGEKDRLYKGGQE